MDELQTRIVDRVTSGGNVFFTGSAGVGKTFVMNQIIANLKIKYGKSFCEKVAVAGMTGIAASHIDGVTLNAALGFGIPRFVNPAYIL